LVRRAWELLRENDAGLAQRYGDAVLTNARRTRFAVVRGFTLAIVEHRRECGSHQQIA